MKLKNKLVLGAATLASIAAPIAAVVSCGGTSGYQGRFDGKDDSKLVLSYSFSATGPQTKALNAIIDKYNEEVEAGSVTGGLPIDLSHQEGGYNSIAPSLSKAYEVGDKDGIPNMTIAYPDVLGVISKYDMQAEIATKTELQLFNNEFTKVNDLIGGLDAGKAYALPIAKSIDMLGINKPVMQYLVSLFSGDTNKITGFTDTSSPTAEQNIIKANFGTKKANGALSKTYDYADIKSNMKTLLEFITDVKNNLSGGADSYILGIDSIANIIYSQVSSATDFNPDDFLFKKGADGYIEYTWKDHSTTAFQKFTEVYNEIKKALEAKALFINISGDYSSGYSTQHKMAMSIGSTAGYKYDFVNADGFGVIGNKSIKMDELTLDTTDGNGIYGTFGSYHNKIRDEAVHGTKYDAVIPAAKKADFTAFITKASGKILGVVSNRDAEGIADEKKFKLNDYKSLVIFDSKTSGDSTLQESEFEVANVPGKFGTGTGVADVQLLQGPSLIGMHVNAKEDAAIKVFTKWFMTTNVTIGTETGKPYEIFAKMADYIVPTNDALNGSVASGANPATALTFNTLHAIQTDANKHGFDNPVDDTTAKFRGVLDSIVAGQFTNSKTNQPIDSAEAIYDAVEHSF